PKALDMLAGYSWPGNVRQLMSVATMGYALADGDTISVNDFEAQLEIGGGNSNGHGDELFDRLAPQPVSFWDGVYEPFMKRELNRTQVKAMIRKGLATANGSYQTLMTSIGLPRDDYQRFMDFLRHHDLKP